MANPLRKTMVYLGLADEDYEDESCPSAPVAPVAAAAVRPPRPGDAAASSGRDAATHAPPA